MGKSKKIISRKTIEIEWGDCDPARIVYFPRYFAFFDACTTALFKKAGISKPQMLKTYGIVGIPMVDVRASFTAPSRFGDTVVVESEITEWRRSSFCVRHRLLTKESWRSNAPRSACGLLSPQTMKKRLRAAQCRKK